MKKYKKFEKIKYFLIQCDWKKMNFQEFLQIISTFIRNGVDKILYKK